MPPRKKEKKLLFQEKFLTKNVNALVRASLRMIRSRTHHGAFMAELWHTLKNESWHTQEWSITKRTRESFMLISELSSCVCAACALSHEPLMK